MWSDYALETPVLEWSDLDESELPFIGTQFNPDLTFNCGQAFRWRRLDQGWVCTIEQAVVYVYTQDGRLLARIYNGDQQLLLRYLRSDFDLDGWARSADDPLLRLAIQRYPGLRLAEQPAEETILTFACSSANPVGRIANSMEMMTLLLGEEIATISGVTYHSFPEAERIASAPETLLRHDCAMAYRARCVQSIARELVNGLAEELPAIRRMPYEEARAKLASYKWIGPKIADCVCLLALGFDCAVPVDTHLWRLARALFGMQIRTKSLTEKTYTQVSRLFRQRYGETAGWAQEYLYHASRQGTLPDLMALVKEESSLPSDMLG